jgi:inosose dehydratase
MTTRRVFLATMGASAVGASSWSAASACGGQTTGKPAAFRFGVNTMTWGDGYVAGLADIAKAGFTGVQLRANAMAAYGNNPGELKALLSRHGLAFACFSSNTVLIGPDKEAETLALHEKNARFVAAAGGQHLQVTDERPKDRVPTADDRKRMGTLLTTLGRRTAALGVALVYHNHMGNLGQRPEEVAEVLDASDPAVVGFLLDMAHYAQAGGDPAQAVRAHRSRLTMVHAKDVRTLPVAPGSPAGTTAFQFVELGRGRVDLPGTFAALREIAFPGWVVLELDAVPDPGGSATASMLASKHYIEQVLQLSF